jgi:hypothetical protein
MVGAAVVGAEADRTPTEHADLAGVALDLAWWHGRFGLAAEGSVRWSVDGDSARALVAGASARYQLFERIVPSLMEPRDVELAFELQAIAEHTWWNDGGSQVMPAAYGLGLAARLRGTGDPDGSALLAESRFFLRVMTAQWSPGDTLARASMPVEPSGRAWTVLIGVGASFGGGTPSYADKFRLHPFGKTLLW